MLHQTALDWEHPEASIHLDFVPQVLTILNPTPFPVLVWAGSGAQPRGLTSASYVCPAGNVLSVPTKIRDWGVKLMTSGSEPENMTPALVFFTQDEPTPSLSLVGVADVAYRKTFNYAKITSDNQPYAINSTSWLALDDNQFKFELECPTGLALIGITARIVRTDGGDLYLGVYDSLTGSIHGFAVVNYSTTASFVGVVKPGTPGLRTFYLRARVRSTGTTGSTLYRSGYGVDSWEFWGMGF